MRNILIEAFSCALHFNFFNPTLVVDSSSVNDDLRR